MKFRFLFSFNNFLFNHSIQKCYFHSKTLVSLKNLMFIQKTCFHSKTLFLFNNLSVHICRHDRQSRDHMSPTNRNKRIAERAFDST